MIMYPYEKYEDRVEFYPVEGKVGFDVSIADGFDGLDKDRFLAIENPKLQNIAKHFDVGGTLVIFKGVPLGAGLGGSSATIACTVKAVAQYLESKAGNTRLDVDFCCLWAATCHIWSKAEYAVFRASGRLSSGFRTKGRLMFAR